MYSEVPKLSVFSSFSDSKIQKPEVRCTHKKGVPSENISKFMKNNQCKEFFHSINNNLISSLIVKLALTKKSSSFSSSDTPKLNEFGFNSENIPNEFLLKYEFIKKINEVHKLLEKKVNKFI